MKYYVYILINKKKRRYVGFTSNIQRRLREHRNGGVSTTKGKDYSLVWYGVFNNEVKAKSFEKYLKSSSGYAFSNKRLI